MHGYFLLDGFGGINEGLKNLGLVRIIWAYSGA